jgi:hypothetical protein
MVVIDAELLSVLRRLVLAGKLQIRAWHGPLGCAVAWGSSSRDSQLSEALQRMILNRI